MAATEARSRFFGMPVQLVYFIEYRQTAGESQHWDHKEALAQARAVFGEPSYQVADIARRGAAYKTSSKYNLVYADVLLTPAAEREALVQQARTSQHEVMKQGLSHPCSAVLRGRCPNGGAPAAAFPGDLDMQLKLTRLQLAPFMLVLPDTAFGIKVIQEWQYLISGDTVREDFRKQQQAAAKPKANADF